MPDYEKILDNLRTAIQEAEAMGLVRTEDGTPITGAVITNDGIVLTSE